MSLRVSILFVAALMLATSCKKEEENQLPLARTSTSVRLEEK